MAITKTVVIDVDTSKAVKGVDDLNDSVKDLDNTIENTSDNNLSGLGDSAEKSTKSVGGLSSGFKGLGTAIKATGIGLLVTLLGSLGAALVENEKLSRPFKVIMEAISVVVNDVVNAISDAIDTASEATGGFDALGKVVGGALTIAINQLKISFLGIKLAVEAAQLVWEKSFFGGNDQDRIKELTESIEDTQKSIQETAKSTTEAGKQIIDNFGEAIGEIGSLTEATIEEVSKVDIASAKARAETNLDLARSAEIAAAQQGLLIAQYDRQAEKLRQVRDNDLKSIEERQKANDDLSKVLDKQEEALLKQADAILAAASAQFQKNQSTENEVALIDAQANKADVLAQIESLRSEQKQNANALDKESIELTNSASEAETNRELQRKSFEASREEDILKRLELENNLLKEERIIEEKRLQLKIDSFNEGTQARLDAENELKDRLQEIDQEITANADEQLKVRKANEDAANAETLKNEQIVQETKVALADNAFKLAGELAEEGSAASKAVQVAQTIMQTIQGVQAAFTTAQKNPITATFPAYPFIQAGAAGAFGALSVRKILSTPTSTTSAGSVGSDQGAGGGQGAQAPAFNLVGTGGVNQIQESLGEEPQPIQAFVVSSNVTTAQELERNQIDSASIG